MNKNILVVNQYNSDNLGDKLLNEMLCKAIVELGYNVTNCGFAQTSPQFVDFSVKQSVNSYIRNIIKNFIPEHIKFKIKYKKRLMSLTGKIDVDDYYAIVIGGGQLIKHNSVFIDCLKYWVEWAVNHNIMVCLYGVGVDSNITKNEMLKYKRILSQCTFINCRDNKSKIILDNLVTHTKINVSPDIAFTIDDVVKIKQDFALVMPYDFKKAVSAFEMKITKRDYYNNLLKIIKSIRSNRIVLSATTSSDAKECFEFKKYLKQQGIDSVVKIISDSKSLISLISNAEVIVTGRMHAMIIAKILGVKIVPITISDKIRVFENEYINGVITRTQIRKLSFEGVKVMIDNIESIST